MKIPKTARERFPAAFSMRGTYWIFGKQYLSVSRPRRPAQQKTISERFLAAVSE